MSIKQKLPCKDLNFQAKTIMKSKTLEQECMCMYEERIKSLMQVGKIFQENLYADEQNGALTFMRTEQFAIYRIDRQFELLKDNLLTEKQKLLIKVIMACQELKKQNQFLKQNKLTKQKSLITKQNQCNVAQKDLQKNISNSNLNNSKFSNIPTSNNENTIPSNINIYQKLLQDKIGLIKELQKKIKTLTIQNETNQLKLKQVNQKIDKSRLIQQQECVQCIRAYQQTKMLNNEIQIITQQNQSNTLKIKQQKHHIQVLQSTVELKNQTIKQLSTEIQELLVQKQQFLLKHKSSLENNQIAKKKDNLETIKKLKQQVIILQQQLMMVSSTFQLIREDFGQTLTLEVKRLKQAHQLLKENLKLQLQTLKSQMANYLIEITERMRLKCIKSNIDNQLQHKLNKLNNQIDYFIQQNLIHLTQ